MIEEGQLLFGKRLHKVHLNFRTETLILSLADEHNILNVKT